VITSKIRGDIGQGVQKQWGQLRIKDDKRDGRGKNFLHRGKTRRKLAEL